MNQQTKADALIKGRQSTEILHLLISNEYALLSLFFFIRFILSFRCCIGLIFYMFVYRIPFEYIHTLS